MIRSVSLASLATLLAGAASAQVNMQPLSIVPAIQTSPAPAAAKPVRRTPPLPPPRPSFEAESVNAAPATAAAPVISGSVAIIPAPALAAPPAAPIEAKALEIKAPEIKLVETPSSPRSDAKPAETAPSVETKAVDSKAAATKAPDAKPIEDKPGDVKAAEVKATAAKPAETKPAETKPAETKPAETKPAETKPAEAKPAETKPFAPLSFGAPAPVPSPNATANTAPAQNSAVEFRPRNGPTQPGIFQSIYGATADIADQLWTGARDQAARLLWSSDSSAVVQRDELFRNAMAAAGFDVENATTEGFLVSYETIVFVARRQATALERERAAQLGADLAKLGGWRSYIEQAALRRAIEPPAPGALPLQSIEVQLWPYPWIKSVLGPMKPR